MLEKNKLLNDKIDSLENELMSVKSQNGKYLEKLLNQKGEIHLGFEKRINIELQRLQETHKTEIESMRNNLIDMYEK